MHRSVEPGQMPGCMLLRIVLFVLQILLFWCDSIAFFVFILLQLYHTTNEVDCLFKCMFQAKNAADLLVMLLDTGLLARYMPGKAQLHAPPGSSLFPW